MSGPQRPPLLALATFDNLRPGGVPVDELFQDPGAPGAFCATRVEDHEVASEDVMRRYWLVRVLAEVRIRPGMWLGSERVGDLDLYLAGYIRARVHLGEDDSDCAVLEAFASWLRSRVDQGRPSSLGWPGLIARIDPSAKNVWTFFNEFEAFLIEGGDELVPHREAWNAARLAAPK